MIILAHRGLWRLPAERNSADALKEALIRGFGVETDIRDRSGRLVISHDPPKDDRALGLDDFLDLYQEAGGDRMLALNIKADGLHEELHRTVSMRGIRADQYFVFDMSVPDALGYLRRGMPCFTRESEIERDPPLLDRAAGVWLDCFERDWIEADTILRHLRGGRRVALVSPELHGRDHNVTWPRWKTLFRTIKSQCQGDDILLCTDHPEQARAFFDD